MIEKLTYLETPYPAGYFSNPKQQSQYLETDRPEGKSEIPWGLILVLIASGILTYQCMIHCQNQQF